MGLGRVLFKGILVLIGVFLVYWNYFKKDAWNIPFISSLSTTTVWIIVGVLVVIVGITSIKFGEKYII